MTNRIDETWKRLLDWTIGQAASERLAARVLSYEKYRDVDPAHPLGGPDGGKDAKFFKDGKSGVMAVYFPRGAQKFGKILKKFKHDLQGARKHGVSVFAFVVNQEIRDQQRRVLQDMAQPLELHLFHLERLAMILDMPEMEEIRRTYLSIDLRNASEPIGPEAKYPRALLIAREIVTKALPPDVFLEYLTKYDFRSGRVPIDKQTAISDLYTRIAQVKANVPRCKSSQNSTSSDNLLDKSSFEVVDALPALGHFFSKLEAHCLSVSQATATELGENPTHFGYFNRPEEIEPSAPGFASHVCKWELTAHALAAAYRTEILDLKSGV